MSRLAPFNTLPTKPQYIKKVVSALKSHLDSRPIDIMNATKLTKTQVMCTLEHLLREEIITRSNNKPTTYRVDSET